jgi:hypothetical protein
LGKYKVKRDSLTSVRRSIQTKPSRDCSLASIVQIHVDSQLGHAAGDLEEKGELRRNEVVASTRLQGETATTQQAVLRIRDVYPGSRILIFTHSGSRIQKQQQKRGVKKN